MSELKACPFCGNEEPRVYKMIQLLGHEHPGFVRCDCVEGVSVARWQSRPIEDELRAELAKWQEQSQMDISHYEAELARRDEIILELKEDAERLAKNPHPFTDSSTIETGTYCHYCHKSSRAFHTADCPISLHHALMRKLEEK